MSLRGCLKIMLEISPRERDSVSSETYVLLNIAYCPKTAPEGNMTRQAYDTDVTDAPWAILQQLFPDHPKGTRGRPREHRYRELVNALIYIVTAGCVCLLPHDLPPWKTV